MSFYRTANPRSFRGRFYRGEKSGADVSDPGLLSSLVVFLDGLEQSSLDDPVSFWESQSPATLDATQSNLAKQPTKISSGVDFAANDFLNLPVLGISGGQTRTFIFVATPTYSGDEPFITQNNGGTRTSKRFNFRLKSSNILRVELNFGSFENTHTAVSGKQVFAVRLAGSNLSNATTYISSESVSSSGSSTINTVDKNNVVGLNSVSTPQRYKGELHEVRIYDDDIGETKLLEIINFLELKHSI